MIDLREFLKSRFDKDRFIDFLSQRFYGFEASNIDSEFLGSVKLDDRKEIGFFVFEVNDNKDISNNRVGFHKELKQYADRYMFDGALGAFYSPSQNAWRLSFVRFGYDDNHKKQVTSQKRFTFLLGNNKVKTAYEQLRNLKYPKMVDLEKAFAVEAITKEFYKGLVSSFEKLLSEYLAYPSRDDSSKKEFAIRLIGRILFIKFLNKKNLVPDTIFELSAGYYRNKLEPLFFEQLNTPKKERKKEFANDSIPFLNGGLFEPLKNLDYYEWDNSLECRKKAGIINDLEISDTFFKELYGHLDQYNFTIDENSIEDSELSIDPEMLGRIFENLLAEINPETSQNARKATGSYYTPREIVEYMVGSSILEYLKTKTNIDEETLKTIVFKNQEPQTDYDKAKILSAIFELKILDPACGSGAFPMGLLQKIVKILNLIDEDASIWFGLQSKEFRESHKNRNKDYIRKLSIIKNTIYGIDIQPIAVEISKLRFFLSLIVDEDGEPEPLPNLEFKFVCANTLLPMPQKPFASLLYYDLEAKLIRRKNEYFEASGKRKEEIKKEYRQTQKEMFDEQEAINLLSALENKLTSYDPFDPVSIAPFFDSDFMFNLKDGFDIVIGNPPYQRVQGIEKKESETYKALYKSATGSYDLYVVFTERAIKLLNKNGIANFIMPHKWVNSAFGKGLREFAKDKFSRFISFREYQVFNASTYTSLVWFKPHSTSVEYIGLDKNLNTNTELRDFLDAITKDRYMQMPSSKLNSEAWTFSDNRTAKILAKLEEQPLRVKDVFEKIFQGLKTSYDDIYILHNCKEGVDTINGFSKYLEQEVEVEIGLTKKLLKGNEIHRYETLKTDKIVIFPYCKTLEGVKEKIELIDEEILRRNFSKGYAYLKKCENALRERENGRFNIDGAWFQFGRKQGIVDADKEKIILSEISLGSNMTLDTNQVYHVGQYSMIKYPHIEGSYKFYLAILNSKLMWFFIQQTGSILRGGYFAYRPDYMNPFPLPKIKLEDTKPFEILVDYVMFLKTQDLKSLGVRYELMPVYFERIIDGMVYELYFEDILRKADREIICHLGELPSIEKIKDDKTKLDTIWGVFNRLNDKNHKVANNLFYMDSIPEIRIIEGKE